jgi:hypothetical protein
MLVWIFVAVASGIYTTRNAHTINGSVLQITILLSFGALGFCAVLFIKSLLMKIVQEDFFVTAPAGILLLFFGSVTQILNIRK